MKNYERLNIGFSANHASTGNNCIGTTKPGNNSGRSTSNGRLIIKGMIRLRRVPPAKRRLVNTSISFWNNLSMLKQNNAINIPANKDALNMLAGDTTRV